MLQFSTGSQNSHSNGTTIHPAVVRIVAPGRDSTSYGSGTLVAKNDKHGLVITNWHVINELTGQLVVVFPDGYQSAGSVLKADQDWDLAAITIWRPNAEPVSLATAAPQPGEVLTIAGYGSGKYRAANGKCTQYVAPGPKFPFEIVELAATARQGDSGGPIFNSRGEMAGVLFGEGHGRTAGSYCGRVQWFLSSVVPPAELTGQRTMIAGRSAVASPTGNQPGGRVIAQPISMQNTSTNSSPVRVPSLARMTETESPAQRIEPQPQFRACPTAAGRRQFATVDLWADPCPGSRTADGRAFVADVEVRQPDFRHGSAADAARLSRIAAPCASQAWLDRRRRGNARSAVENHPGGRRCGGRHVALAQLAGQSAHEACREDSEEKTRPGR